MWVGDTEIPGNVEIRNYHRGHGGWWGEVYQQQGRYWYRVGTLRPGGRSGRFLTTDAERAVDWSPIYAPERDDPPAPPPPPPPPSVVETPPVPIENPPTIPPWIARPPASDINDMSSVSTETVAASGSIIPLIYGKDRIYGKPIVIHITSDGSYLYVAYAFCQGPIEAVDSLFVDGVDITDSTNGILARYPDTQYNVYLGTTTQVADPLLMSVITGYADTLTEVPTAYVVFRFPRGSTQGFPRCEAIIRGLKVYDPRKDSTQTTISPAGAGAHRLNDSTTWEYSETPALHGADLCIRHGGWSVHWQGVVDTANSNDETLSNGEPRRRMGLALLDQRQVSDWIKVFRMYMSAFICWENGQVRFIPDSVIPDLVPARHYTDADIVAGSVRHTQRSIRDYPTVLVLEYRDSSQTQWRMAKVRVSATGVGTTVPARVSKVSLPGIHRKTQATREAYQRLNSFRADRVMEMMVFDEGMELQIGSVIQVTHGTYITGTLWRVMTLKGHRGFWSLLLLEYDPTMYSDDVSAIVEYNVTNVVSVISEPPPQGGFIGDVEVIEFVSLDPYWQYVKLLARVDNNQYRDVSMHNVPIQVVNDPRPTAPVLSGEAG